jgi:spore germination protein
VARRGRAAAVAVLWAVVLGGCGMAGRASPRPAPAPEVIGFWAAGTDTALDPLPRYRNAISVFAPFWYSIEPDGRIVDRVDPAIAAQVASLGIPVAPLFNTPGPQTFLASLWDRLMIVRQISSLVRQHHYAGVDIDFEPPQTQYARDLTAFIIDLKDFLPHHTAIYLDIVPASGGAYDFARLNREVTAYVVMSYDQHDSGSTPGPVAATDWAEAKITRLLQFIPADRLDMGLAWYGYDWLGGTTHAETLPISAIPSALATRAHYDPSSQEMTASYTDDRGLLHTAWWETPQGLASKIQWGKAHHLRGFAVWRLGYQNASLLQQLIQQIHPVAKR